MIRQIQLPEGINSDDTDFSSPRYVDCENIRFRNGFPEVVGGFEKFTLQNLPGVCRNIFGWTDLAGINNYAFGQHNGLHVDQNGDFADITPAAATSGSGTLQVLLLPSADETFVVGSQTFTFKTTRSGTGQVTIGADVSACAANIVTAVNADIGSAVTAVASGDTVTVTADTTGFASNLAFTSATAKLFLSGQGFLEGGGTFVAGNIDGSGFGFGSGPFGQGNYGVTTPGQFFALTWSGGSRRGVHYFNPRGQTAFVWDNNTANDAKPLGNAPQVINYLLTTNNGQLMALGCTNTTGTYNPLCVRTTDPGDPTKWRLANEVTAQEFFINGNGRLVGGQRVGRYVVALTDSDVHLLQYDGLQWTAEEAGPGGLCGPNACIEMGGSIYWLTPDLKPMVYTPGGAPDIIPCRIYRDFSVNASRAQNTKIVASSYRAENEIRWDYADRRDGDGVEISRYIVLNVATGAWFKGTYARTAYLDSGPGRFPIGVDYDGNIYSHEVKDENGASSADGQAFSWSLKAEGLIVGDASRNHLIREFRPDISQQVGPVYLRLYASLWQQGEATEFGPYTLTAGMSKADVLCSARMLGFELRGGSLPAGGRIGVPSLDITPQGQY